MGHYSVINLTKVCPNCGAKVEWQSKRLIIDEIYPIDRVIKLFSLLDIFTFKAHFKQTDFKTLSKL